MRKDNSYDMFEDTKWSNQKPLVKQTIVNTMATLAKKRNKMTNTDLQNTTQKTKDRATRTPLKTGGLGLLFLFDITTT